MPIDCSPQNLITQAQCITSCLPPGAQLAALVSLFCTIANNANLNAACTEATAVISGTDIDWTVAPLRFKQIGANTTFTFSNFTEGKTVTVYLQQVNNFTVAWPLLVKFPGAVQPTFTPIAGRYDIFTFTVVNGVTFGTYVQNLG